MLTGRQKSRRPSKWAATSGRVNWYRAMRWPPGVRSEQHGPWGISTVCCRFPAMGRQLNQGGVKVGHPVHQDRPVPLLRERRARHHAQFPSSGAATCARRQRDQATDILWTCTSDELYDLLVTQRGWSLPRFARFLADFMTTGLLPRPNERRQGRDRQAAPGPPRGVSPDRPPAGHSAPSMSPPLATAAPRKHSSPDQADSL
jgi:hypothetical protein